MEIVFKELGTISPKCKKCGSQDCGIRYIGGDDQMECTCRRCGWSWYVDPLDKKEKMSKEDFDKLRDER